MFEEIYGMSSKELYKIMEGIERRNEFLAKKLSEIAEKKKKEQEVSEKRKEESDDI